MNRFSKDELKLMIDRACWNLNVGLVCFLVAYVYLANGGTSVSAANSLLSGMVIGTAFGLNLGGYIYWRKVSIMMSKKKNKP